MNKKKSIKLEEKVKGGEGKGDQQTNLSPDSKRGSSVSRWVIPYRGSLKTVSKGGKK